MDETRKQRLNELNFKWCIQQRGELPTDHCIAHTFKVTGTTNDAGDCL